MLLLVACTDTVSQNDQNKTATSYTSAAINPNPTYKVTGIKDGDTFVLLMEGREQVVRLAHIDCPEKRQPFGSRAKTFASDKAWGTYVTLVHEHKYDRNHRLIAEVILADGRNLNKELVEQGLAWHFKKYSGDEEYARLEAGARQGQVGLWSEPDALAPWEWRKPARLHE